MNTFNNNAVQNGVKQPYLLTTKELESNFGINSYDFGARMQDMTIGRWYGIDELAEKHYGNSPYAFCGNNPAIFADYDGKDYGVTFEGNTVTFSMTVYTNAKSEASLRQSAARVTSQNGDFSYVVGEGDNATVFSINFNVNIVVENSDGEINMAWGNDRSGEVNAYTVVKDEKLPENQNGTTQFGNDMNVKESKSSNESGAHELGHAMGMTHGNKGLMMDSEKNRHGTDKFTPKDVEKSLQAPLKGKVNSEYQDNQEHKAGKGIIHNKTNFSNKELLKGKVISNVNTSGNGN